MATSLISNRTGPGRTVENANTGDGDSDYGSDFSLGEEELVEKLLQDLASSDASSTRKTSPSKANHKDGSTGNGIGNGQRHALLSTSSQAPTAPTRAPTTTRLARESSPDSQVSDTSQQEQGDVSSDTIAYPDCKSTGLGRDIMMVNLSV
jgi:hypothetical protein